MRIIRHLSSGLTPGFSAAYSAGRVV